ncbi:hypothetical protein PIB30_071689 [Stylosanthes scabra]|uniref:Uncharacterized protein n=1 Tax=Stylosanthes scabra TaxID=79078 RepID=A0ABU6RP34_9FABA|nr:hypothetical protein [Stylosanthes scabra]
MSKIEKRRKGAIVIGLEQTWTLWKEEFNTYKSHDEHLRSKQVGSNAIGKLTSRALQLCIDVLYAYAHATDMYAHKAGVMCKSHFLTCALNLVQVALLDIGIGVNSATLWWENDPSPYSEFRIVSESGCEWPIKWRRCRGNENGMSLSSINHQGFSKQVMEEAYLYDQGYTP